MYLKLAGLSSTLILLFSIVNVCAFPVAGQQNESKPGQTKAEATDRDRHPQPTSMVEIHGSATVVTRTSEPKDQAAKAEPKPFLTHGEWVMAILTAIYVGISYFGLRAIKRQADFAQRQVADNAKTFVVTQRPKLIVRNVVVKQPKSVHGRDPYLFEHGHPVIGQFYVANVGGSSAHIIESLCWVRALQGINLPMERPYEGEYGNNPVPICDLNPGQPITAIIGAPPDATFIPTQAQSDGIRLSDTELGALNATRWNLYVFGWIDYRDDIGIVRRTAFCRRYEPATGRFVKVNDPDYENED